MAEYVYPDIVTAVLRAANVRKPRLYPTVIPELAEIISREINRGEWVLIGDQPARASNGATPEGRIDELVLERTGEDGKSHWEEPETISAAHDSTWCGPVEGALKRQGDRYKIIRAAYPPGKENDKLCAKILGEEAALYNCKVGDPKPGTPPGEPEKAKAAAPKLPGQDANTNPWHPKFHGDALAAQIAIISSKGGPALAASLARSCNVDLAGRPLPAGKSYK
jgi:hypothetical protein